VEAGFGLYQQGEQQPRKQGNIKVSSMNKEYDFSKGKRGPVIKASKGKTRITIRLDDDVLDWFRQQVHSAGGGNYQTLINMALREYMNAKREPLEDTLRHIIREELSAYGKKSKL
jgi:uncharacterized protein (DUF4415 family)